MADSRSGWIGTWIVIAIALLLFLSGYGWLPANEESHVSLGANATVESAGRLLSDSPSTKLGELSQSVATGKVEVDLLNGNSIVAPDLTYNGFFNTVNTSFPTLLAGSDSSSFWGTGQSVLLLAPSLSFGHDTGNLLFRSLAGENTSVTTVGVFSPSLSGDGLDAYLFVNPLTYGNWTGPFFATDPEGPNGTFVSPQGSVIFPYSQTPYIEVQWDPGYGELADYHVYMVTPDIGGVVTSGTIQTSNVGTTLGAAPAADDYLDFNVSYSTTSGTLTGSIYDVTAGHAISDFSDNLTELGFTPSFDLSTPYWFGAGGNGNHPAGWGLLYLGLSIGGTADLTTDWDPAENAYSIGNPGSTWKADGNCYGLSSTALLYYEHYVMGLSGAPYYPDVAQYYPNPLPYTAAYPSTQSTWDTLDNVTLAIYLHQLQQPGVNWGPLWGSNSQSATEVIASLHENQPVAVAINGPEFQGKSIAHSVIFFGAISYANGTDEFYVSDPNEADASVTTYAWYYANGTFTYTNGNGNPGVTWTEFQPQATPLISLSWWHWPPWQPWDISTIAKGWEIVLASTAVTVSTTGGPGTAQSDHFTDSDGGNSETFVQGIPGTSGIEEGVTQAYGIPPGVSVSVNDPSASPSATRIEWGTNQSGQLTGYAIQVNTTSGVSHEFSLMKTGQGFSIVTNSTPVEFNLTLVGSALPGWTVLNASDLQLGVDQAARFTVSSWTTLNDTTTPSVSVVITNTTTEKIVGNYTLVNGQVSWSPHSNARPFYTQLWFTAIVVVVTALVLAVVVLVRNRGRRSAPPARDETETKR